jgi:glycosyltransferase EpsF
MGEVIMELDRKIRIVHVVGKVGTGGVMAVVMNYYRNIDRNQVQFDFVMDGYNATDFDKEIEALGGKVYKVEAYEKNIIKNMLQCNKIFKDNHYKVVHSHLNTLSIFPLFVAWLSGVQVRVSHSHTTAAKGEGKRNLMKYILRPFSKIFANYYCACSELAGKWLFGQSFYNKGKVKLVKNAIDITRYSYNAKTRNKLRKDMNLEDKFVIGHVGRFVFQKNHTFLIDIFNEVHKKNDNVVLVLVGEGELEEPIKNKVKALSLTDCVMFLGVRRDVPELMQAMDLFLLPSFYEGLPVVGVEAQAAGLKCILSDAVTQETKITELATFVGITESKEAWSDEICKHINRYNREDRNAEIVNAGFEINKAAEDLLLWYKKLPICKN